MAHGTADSNTICRPNSDTFAGARSIIETVGGADINALPMQTALQVQIPLQMQMPLQI